MKRFILLFSLIFSLASCSLQDDGPSFHTELLPISEVEIPQEFQLGQTYTIKVWYQRPSTCHVFDGFYYDKNLNIRTVAVRSAVVHNNDCQELSDQLVEASFNFYVTSNGSYIFKFWQGTNENGEDVFYEVEVPVID